MPVPGSRLGVLPFEAGVSRLRKRAKVTVPTKASPVRLSIAGPAQFSFAHAVYSAMPSTTSTTSESVETARSRIVGPTTMR